MLKEYSILIKHRNSEWKYIFLCMLCDGMLFIKFHIFQIICVRNKIFLFFKNESTVCDCFFLRNRKHESRMSTNMVIHLIRIFVYYTVIHR